jgi:hypothetical protein
MAAPSLRRKQTTEATHRTRKLGGRQRGNSELQTYLSDVAAVRCLLCRYLGELFRRLRRVQVWRREIARVPLDAQTHFTRKVQRASILFAKYGGFATLFNRFVLGTRTALLVAVTKRAGSCSRVLATSALKKFNAGRRDRRFVRYGPQHDGGFITVAPDHLVQLLFGLGQHGGIIEVDRPIDRNSRPDQNAHAIGQTAKRVMRSSCG